MSAQVLAKCWWSDCALRGLFVYRQLHLEEPFLELRILKRKLCDQRGGKYAFIFCDDGILHADAALRTVYYGMFGTFPA